MYFIHWCCLNIATDEGEVDYWKSERCNTNGRGDYKTTVGRYGASAEI
jgi:hypothetical protein